MKKIKFSSFLFIFFAMSFLTFVHSAEATTISSAQSGNWATTSTWTGGVVPGPGDVAVIGAHTVTIPEGTSVTVGAGADAAIVLNSASSKLVQNGNLTVNADIRLEATGARYEITSIASQPVLTMKSSSTETPTINMYFGGGVFAVTGNSTYWAKIIGDQTSGGFSLIDGLVIPSSAPFYFRYAQFEKLGDPDHPGLYRMYNIDSDHVRIINSGETTISPSGGDAVTILRHWDVRPGANSPSGAGSYLVFTNPADPLTTGTRELSGSTFYSSSPATVLYFGSPNWTISGNVFDSAPIQFADTSISDTLDKNAFVGSYDLGGWVILVPGNGGLNITNTAFLEYSSTRDGNGGSNGHVNQITATDNGIGANVWDGIIRDGGGSGADYTGDFVLSNFQLTVKNSIFTGLIGNIVDGLFDTAQQTVTHTTSYNITDAAGFGAVVLSEGAGNTSKNKNITSNIFTSEPDGVVIGASSGWVDADETFVLDYNDSFGLTDPTLLYNPALSTFGYLQAPQVPRNSTVVAQSGTNQTHAVLSGTGLGVLLGDYAGVGGTNFALITAVTEGGGNTTLTLGTGNASTAGIAGLTSGSSVTVYHRYWASGGVYGDNNKGQHDLALDPKFIDPTRSQKTWDTANGGPGTTADVADQAVKLNGLDKNGSTATFNTAYSVDNYLSYMRRGFTPTNPLLKTSLAHTTDNQDIGAVSVVDATSPIAEMVTPSNSSTISGTVTVTASSTDDFDIAGQGVQGIKFYYNDLSHQIGSEITATSSPHNYQTLWDTTGVTNGTYTIFAVSRDLAGNTVISSSITVTVNNSVAPPPPPVTSGGGGGSIVGLITSPLGLIPAINSTSTTSTTSMSSVASLQAELNLLLVQLHTLQTTQAQQGGAPKGANYASLLKTANFPHFFFTHALYEEYRGPEVLLLQKLLNTLGFTVAKSGPGSPGNETNLFGGGTWKAVSAMQKAAHIPNTGFVGPLTRAWLNGLQ